MELKSGLLSWSQIPRNEVTGPMLFQFAGFLVLDGNHLPLGFEFEFRRNLKTPRTLEKSSVQVMKSGSCSSFCHLVDSVISSDKVDSFAIRATRL